MARSTGGLEGAMNVTSAIVLVFIAVATIVETAVLRERGCTISINYFNGDLKEPQPLLLKYEKNGTSFVYPIDKMGTVKLVAGERLQIACPGKGNYIQGFNNLKNLSEFEATCVNGKTFVSASKRFEFPTLACKFLPYHVARRTKSHCYENAEHVEIGFELRNGRFLRTIEICRNSATMTTYWSKFSLPSSIAGSQSGFPRPYKWQSGDYYGKYNLDRHFQAQAQVRTVAELVGSTQLANKYLNRSRSFFFARGHLSAKADFVYGAAQLSTFWYMNAAPQWQSFNAGNWNTLEMDVRNYAATSKSNLDVYTGTWGQGSLKDINGNQVPIHLYVNGTERTFPVPRYYWKIIHDPLTQRATAFIGLNDPWIESITEDTFICNDIAEKITWLRWQPRKITKGVSFACDVNDIRKTVPYIPRFKVQDILM